MNSLYWSDAEGTYVDQQERPLGGGKEHVCERCLAVLGFYEKAHKLEDCIEELVKRSIVQQVLIEDLQERLTVPGAVKDA